MPLYQPKSYDIHLVENSPLNDVRLRIWERNFPGIGDHLGEIFNTQMPTPLEVAKWKLTWYETTPYQMKILDRELTALLMTPGVREEIYQLGVKLGIHPYFWEYWQHRREELGDPGDIPQVIITPMLSFYYEEHHVMFKLAW